MSDLERKLASLGAYDFEYAEGMTHMMQMQFNGRWINLGPAPSQDDGEWAIAGWKQANKCLGDPFRVIPISEL